ncbi:hypothetical protein EYF80_064993 [Liparis tanakae]|uniref:Uncharacterized protein n=1 Tax=Liparis tanakae TaxID=230148 RepID=A0A4Z2E8I5_9TELE|nr:hypothetical protein EYF80_064993 [Liparis tanakae]
MLLRPAAELNLQAPGAPTKRVKPQRELHRPGRRVKEEPPGGRVEMVAGGSSTYQLLGNRRFEA